jgi:hypothetical protein
VGIAKSQDGLDLSSLRVGDVDAAKGGILSEAEDNDAQSNEKQQNYSFHGVESISKALPACRTSSVLTIKFAAVKLTADG